MRAERPDTLAPGRAQGNGDTRSAVRHRLFLPYGRTTSPAQMRGFFVPAASDARVHNVRFWEPSPTGLRRRANSRCLSFCLGEGGPRLALHLAGPRQTLHEQHPLNGKRRPLEPSSNCASGSPFEKQLPQLFEVFIGPAPG